MATEETTKTTTHKRGSKAAKRTETAVKASKTTKAAKSEKTAIKNKNATINELKKRCEQILNFHAQP